MIPSQRVNQLNYVLRIAYQYFRNCDQYLLVGCVCILKERDGSPLTQLKQSLLVPHNSDSLHELHCELLVSLCVLPKEVPEVEFEGRLVIDLQGEDGQADGAVDLLVVFVHELHGEAAEIDAVFHLLVEVAQEGRTYADQGEPVDQV